MLGRVTMGALSIIATMIQFVHYGMLPYDWHIDNAGFEESDQSEMKFMKLVPYDFPNRERYVSHGVQLWETSTDGLSERLAVRPWTPANHPCTMSSWCWPLRCDVSGGFVLHVTHHNMREYV